MFANYPGLGILLQHAEWAEPTAISQGLYINDLWSKWMANAHYNHTHPENVVFPSTMTRRGNEQYL